MEKTNTKKELKVVLSPELYDELRFIFRPETLENIIYKPEILSETKWQCCCGSESELEVCPICGMEKNTVLSKVNASYLARHRKARIAKKRKAAQEKQALMAAQMLKKTNKAKKDKDNNKKAGTLIGVLFLCVAVIACIFIIFNDKPQDDNPKDTTGTTINTTSPEDTTAVPEDTTAAPEETTTSPEDTTKSPEDTTTTPEDTTTTPEDTTTIPEETGPATPPPAEPIQVPTTVTKEVIATIGEGKWASGAVGNLAAGGLIYTDDQYDYIANNGIRVLDKAGKEVSVLTENKALCLTGSGKYIFYIDEQNNVHRINTETKADLAFSIKASSICTYFDELYYTPFEAKGLYAADFFGNNLKILTLQQVYAISNVAEKLYFSTEESLCVITSKDSNVLSICADGAKATSILEIVDCIFYTSEKGELKFYNPKLSQIPGIEFPRYNVKFTCITAYENRVYIRTVNPYTNVVEWICTRWTPGTRMFAPTSFASTGIYTDSFYATSTAIYDGNFNRRTVS